MKERESRKRVFEEIAFHYHSLNGLSHNICEFLSNCLDASSITKLYTETPASTSKVNAQQGDMIFFGCFIIIFSLEYHHFNEFMV